MLRERAIETMRDVERYRALLAPTAPWTGPGDNGVLPSTSRHTGPSAGSRPGLRPLFPNSEKRGLCRGSHSPRILPTSRLYLDPTRSAPRRACHSRRSLLDLFRTRVSGVDRMDTPAA